MDKIEVKTRYKMLKDVENCTFISYSEIENYLKEHFESCNHVAYYDIEGAIIDYLHDNYQTILFPRSSEYFDEFVNISKIVDKFLHFIKPHELKECCKKSINLYRESMIENPKFCFICGKFLKNYYEQNKV